MNKYVLIVNDEPDTIAQLSASIHEVGLETRSATNNLEVLDSLRKIATDPPAVILLDVTMPDLDGAAVRAWLGQNPRTHRIPLIVVSAAEPDQAGAGFLNGVASVLTKGECTPEGLSELVWKIAFGS